eukprot:1141245-Pelagomonas_calceolata.AAC.3
MPDLWSVPGLDAEQHLVLPLIPLIFAMHTSSRPHPPRLRLARHPHLTSFLIRSHLDSTGLWFKHQVRLPLIVP